MKYSTLLMCGFLAVGLARSEEPRPVPPVVVKAEAFEGNGTS
jgi:hypothetical protein